MCSLILLALNTFLATPGCVAGDGAATVAAQRWGAYVLEQDGYRDAERIYANTVNTTSAGASARPSNAYSTSPHPFVGFSWFAGSYTLVLEDTRSHGPA
jgi:hypothetical protein